MKKVHLFFLVAVAVAITIGACQKDAQQEITVSTDQNAAKKSGILPEAACNPNAYTVKLESITQVGGNWEWVWSVKNPNPGNGNGGTVQDLSHWGMQFGTCFNWNSVVSAAYSSNGSSWTSFTPSYKVDPSQNCMTTPVLKFDFGTSGGNKSYYKLVVDQQYSPGTAPAYYKSGKRTGCCTFQFTGIGCGNTPE